LPRPRPVHHGVMPVLLPRREPDYVTGRISSSTHHWPSGRVGGPAAAQALKKRAVASCRNTAPVTDPAGLALPRSRHGSVFAEDRGFVHPAYHSPRTRTRRRPNSGAPQASPSRARAFGSGHAVRQRFCLSNHLEPKNRELAATHVADYIVSFYSHSRRHGHLGGVSPEQFEAAHNLRNHFGEAIEAAPSARSTVRAGTGAWT